jgi:hypothetical protein
MSEKYSTMGDKIVMSRDEKKEIQTQRNKNMMKFKDGR